ncbi:uncharacterized protein LOC141641709 [Silene latifolia]|uniref:uncharacterized protein LOC141641709 n=1 Tax=Silene latifolia TaxID=37657 RepID=UPI003D76A984
MEEAVPESYADSPFIDEIARVDLPKKFVIPFIRTYDGTSDPQNHVAFYKQKMLAASIPCEFRQVCMCKRFGTTLTGTALQWYINLPNGSIKSFADLVNTFNQQFASSRELKKRSSDLYRITQITHENIKSFLARFNKEKVSIPRCDIDKVVEAFRPNRKSGGRSNNYMSGPYTRSDQSEVNLTQEQQGLIKWLDNMGSVVRQPKSKEGSYQMVRNSHGLGHTTEDWFTLRKEVAYLLKAGYLKDLIKARGRIEDPDKNNQEQKQERNLPPHLHSTNSTAKKIARTPQTKSLCKPDNIPPITFSDCDLAGVLNIHHDGLIITMQIGTANVRRILVDGGSSVNLIMLDVLKAMKIKEDQITRKSSVLVGFSGETKNTLGEIYLPTYVEGVASYERFRFLDCLSSYNVILGRPWIHNFKAVPSTYHQCIKIPTDWGVATIKVRISQPKNAIPRP